MKDWVVTMQDCRASGVFCASGGRAFFNKHGLDWRSFIKNGVPYKDLYDTNDALARACCDVAKKRYEALDGGQ